MEQSEDSGVVARPTEELAAATGGEERSVGQRGGASAAGRNRPARGVDFPLRILVSSDMVGAIIGRGGATIRNITQESRARVDVHRYRLYTYK